MRRFTGLMILALLVGTSLMAQHKVKAGLGINYISNTYKEPHLYDYVAPSFHVNYTFFEQSKFALAIETASSLRIKQGDNNYDGKFGFTSSLPLMANLRLAKTTLYAGAGPAYVKQVSEDLNHNERASGYFLTGLAGVGFKGKAIIDGALFPEYNIRLSYLKNISHSGVDGAMISFIVLLM